MQGSGTELRLSGLVASVRQVCFTQSLCPTNMGFQSHNVLCEALLQVSQLGALNLDRGRERLLFNAHMVGWSWTPST